MSTSCVILISHLIAIAYSRASIWLYQSTSTSASASSCPSGLVSAPCAWTSCFWVVRFPSSNHPIRYFCPRSLEQASRVRTATSSPASLNDCSQIWNWFWHYCPFYFFLSYGSCPSCGTAGTVVVLRCSSLESWRCASLSTASDLAHPTRYCSKTLSLSSPRCLAFRNSWSGQPNTQNSSTSASRMYLSVAPARAPCCSY